MDIDTLEYQQDKKSIGLEDIILKLSRDDIIGNEGSHFFDTIMSQIAPNDVVLGENIRSLLSDTDDVKREDNKLELITVFSIIKTIEHTESLLNEPLNLDSARKINILLGSLVGSFKYHFQLPVDHNNYAFKNFGGLIATPKLNILNPFITYMKILTSSCITSSSSFYELNKSETLEKTFCLLLILHCFNSELFKFLSNFLINDDNANKIFHSFDLNSLKIKSKTVSLPSIFNIYQRFRMTLLLEDSTLTNDLKSNNLLNILFFSSFHKHFLIDFIENISQFYKFFNDDNFYNLFEISTQVLKNPTSLHYLTLIITYNNDYVNLLDDSIKSETTSQHLKDLSMYLLLKCSQNYLLNYNLFSPSNELISYLIEYNNSNYTSILGLSEESNFQLNVTTLIPVFEIIDQNIKLDYSKERDFLTIVKLSLINLDLNLDELDAFMNINSLLVDIGCSLSINALLDTLKTLLCAIINNIRFAPYIFNKIPNDFIKFLGFQFIPPVYRSDMSFENNIDLQSEFFGSTFKNFQNIENYSTTIEVNCLSLLEECLTLVLSLKTKTFKFLKVLNDETNVLRLPDLFDEENKVDDYPLSIFKHNISTRIGSFKSNKALNYKLLNFSISLELTANLSLLIVAENYKYLKISDNMIDNSISRFLNEFAIDSSLTFLIIYQEFGLLSFFKKLRDLNQENLKLILPTAVLVSKLFQVRNSDLKLDQKQLQISSQTSNFDLISEILYKSVIASNLLRQFVELFDDGQSRPFKSLNKFLKAHPSTLKPSKISKGVVNLDVNNYKSVLCLE